MLTSNGYGSFLQKIVIRVAARDHIAVCRQLGVAPERCRAGTPWVELIYNRRSSHRKDDECVVLDLRIELGELFETTDWQIDWDASKF